MRERVHESQRQAISSGMDRVENISTVKYYGVEASETSRFQLELESQTAAELQRKYALYEGILFGNIMYIISSCNDECIRSVRMHLDDMGECVLTGGLSAGVNVSLLAVLYAGGSLVRRGSLSSGDLFKFSIYR